MARRKRKQEMNNIKTEFKHFYALSKCNNNKLNQKYDYDMIKKNLIFQFSKTRTPHFCEIQNVSV